MNTELTYMTEGNLLECTSVILEMHGEHTIILPATIFYPQGGGQPYDQGVITGKKGAFHVHEVRNMEGVVHHIGVLEGEMAVGEAVRCAVDVERRTLNTRVHSAAHLVDVAVHHVGFTWIPGKGYSFPNGPYVEYSGDFSGLDLERAKERIEAVCRELIASDLPVTIEFMDRGEMIERLPFVPDYLPENRPARVVFMGDYGIPCGGTHVKSIKEVGSVAIRKMKLSGDTLRVSYQVE